LSSSTSYMAQPWSYSFAFSDGESEGEDEDAIITKAQQMQGVQFTEQTAEQDLSEDTRLARDLDFSTRKDTVIFRETPWTVAKSNAASRPTRKPSNPSIADPNTLKSSNGSLLTTESTKRTKEVSQKNLTQHFKRSSNRKETSGSTVEHTRPAVQETVVTKPKKKEASPQNICSIPQKQTRPFITPLKHPLQSSLTEKPILSNVEGMSFPLVCSVRYPSSSRTSRANRTKTECSNRLPRYINSINYA
jgi:hypothetical protein